MINDLRSFLEYEIPHFFCESHVYELPYLLIFSFLCCLVYYTCLLMTFIIYMINPWLPSHSFRHPPPFKIPSYSIKVELPTRVVYHPRKQKYLKFSFIIYLFLIYVFPHYCLYVFMNFLSWVYFLYIFSLTRFNILFIYFIYAYKYLGI